MMFAIVVAGLSTVAGAIAAVAGFGIGSLLTPIVGIRFGVQQAVALVAIPHFAATVLRAWRMRKRIDREVLLRFGIASAAGGLTGAFLHERLKSNTLGIVLGCLLVFAGVIGLTG